VRQLPDTLAQASETLEAVQPFADELGPAARDLVPVFNALERANAATRPLGREATPILRNQIRPFVREARPLVRDLRPAAQGLNRTFPDLTRTVRVLNTFFNLLGYNDKGREGPAVKDRDEGYLFWLAWTSHQATNLINIDDANGPMRPIFLTGTCTTLAKVVGDRPEFEFAMGLSAVLANLCGNPQTSSINLPLQRKLTRMGDKAQAEGDG
jgi:phospholipid/cholesterol/gamma-HCH transport system substrate-binding protein